MAFFNTPGIERLYSGVTNSTPFDFCSFSRNASQSAGGLASRSWLKKEMPSERRHVELQRGRRQFCERIGDLERKALLAKRA